MGFIRSALARWKAGRQRNARAAEMLKGLNPELMRRAIRAADAVEMPLDAWIVFALASELLTDEERREGDGGVDAAFRLASIERRGARLFRRERADHGGNVDDVQPATNAAGPARR